MTQDDTAYVHTDQDTNNSDVEVLHKRWHKTGFISIGFWPKGEKVVIEIGSVVDSKLVSATKCYVPAVNFLAYLRAEINDTLELFYPTFEEKGLSFFGGGNTAKGVVSRIVKLSYYKNRDNTLDKEARGFTALHFAGQFGKDGLVEPIYNSKISANSIKISMAELSIIFELVRSRFDAEAVLKLIADD